MGNTGESDSIESSLRFSLHNTTFRLVLGILSALVGILKLLSPALDGIPFLGDFLPGLGGIAAGFVLIFGSYRERATIASEGALDRVGDAFLKYRKGVGIILLAIAVLHFLFPQALFL
jgi:hypothetical protein